MSHHKSTRVAEVLNREPLNLRGRKHPELRHRSWSLKLPEKDPHLVCMPVNQGYQVCTSSRHSSRRPYLQPGRRSVAVGRQEHVQNRPGTTPYATERSKTRSLAWGSGALVIRLILGLCLSPFTNATRKLKPTRDPLTQQPRLPKAADHRHRIQRLIHTLETRCPRH